MLSKAIGELSRAVNDLSKAVHDPVGGLDAYCR